MTGDISKDLSDKIYCCDLIESCIGENNKEPSNLGDRALGNSIINLLVFDLSIYHRRLLIIISNKH